MDTQQLPKGELRFNLTYDIPFKFMFAQKGETEDLLARFLNYILELKGEQKIIKLTYNNIEIPENHARGRRLILDLKVTDQQNNTYNIELQREDRASILSRALYQYSRITGDQLVKNDNFDKIKPVYIVLLCKYNTYPDQEALRVFKLAPFKLSSINGQKTLPYEQGHFDSQNLNSYPYLKHRVKKANHSLNSLKIYLVELSKDLKDLSPDQQSCLKYLTTDFLFRHGEPAMNSKVNQTQDLNDSQQQNSQQNSKYFIHKDASAEVKKWLAEAQKRLEYFAGQPAQREAYEQELMFILDHNTAIKQHHEEGFIEGKAEGLAEGKAEGKAEGISAGRASLLPSFIQMLKASGRSEEEICTKLGLNKEEQKLYFK